MNAPGKRWNGKPRLSVVSEPADVEEEQPPTVAGFRQKLLEREFAARTVDIYCREAKNAEWWCNQAGRISSRRNRRRASQGQPRSTQCRPPSPKRPTGPRVRAYKAVATVYSKAWELGEKPRQAVAEHFDTSSSAAAKWIFRCRELGLLEPTTRGRAGGAPRRSSTPTTQRRNKKKRA